MTSHPKSDCSGKKVLSKGKEHALAWIAPLYFFFREDIIFPEQSLFG